MKCIYKNRLGASGEMIARNFLLKKKYKFIAGNFRFQRAEIDLIFEDEINSVIIFVEVKSRRNKKFGEPEESVNFSKQKNIKKAAMGFIAENPEYSSYSLRIDIVSVFFSDGKAEVNHIENAF